MSMTDPIADMLVRIKNALAVGKPQVSMPASKMKLAIADVLKAEGYIGDFRVTGEKAAAKLEIALKYYEGRPGDLFRFTRSPDPFKVLTLQPRRIQFEDLQGTFWINLTPNSP